MLKTRCIALVYRLWPRARPKRVSQAHTQLRAITPPRRSLLRLAALSIAIRATSRYTIHLMVGKRQTYKTTLLNHQKKAYYISYAQDYVKQELKSPSTAEFPGTFWGVDDYAVTRYKDTITVRSYVDSQNGFGATVRSNFIVQLDYSDCSCKYLEIDGSVLYKE